LAADSKTMGRWDLLTMSMVLWSCGGANVPRASATEAAVVVTATAAVLHVAAGGCKNAGCTAGLACNPVSELCEPIPCGPAGCPVGTTCEIDRCVAQ
jgi:hypothetical protein